jgi:Holliday junction resolvase RusA-like endonuclease
MSERVRQFVMDLAIKPKGQGRPRFAGHAYTPKPTRDYADALRSEARRVWAGREPLSGPLAASITARFALPKSAKGRVYHTQRPDADNVAKAVLDALMPEHKKRRGERVMTWPGVIMDDAQIVHLRASKEWSIDGDWLHVCIWSLE